MIVMRSCKKDGTSHNGFQWPLEAGAEVVAPDWRDNKECGNGLHGLLPGQNDPGVWHGELIYFLEVDSVVDLGGKVKFEKCKVLFVGEPSDAWAWARLNAPGPWYRGTAITGHYGTAAAGYGGTATAGHYGTATAGDGGTATARHYGTATARDGGTATAGYGGTATTGDIGTATTGDYGTAITGNKGTATAGGYGTLCIKHWDGLRYRLNVAYVGEDGIKANTPYKLDDEGNFVEVKK